MISAEAAEGLVQDTDAPLHNDYLIKPINMPALLQSLSFHLNIELQTADEVETPNKIAKSKPFCKSNPVVINELLSLIEIGYLEGFKNTLAPPYLPFCSWGNVPLVIGIRTKFFLASSTALAMASETSFDFPSP